MEPAAKRLCTVMSSQGKRIAVEGNIATGKSTFLELLRERNSRYCIVSEPITKWTNVPSDDKELSLSQKWGGNLLQLFYQDPCRWAYTFQTYACLSRLRAQLKELPSNHGSSPVVFYERSVYSDKYCFAENCHDTGLINDTEWQIYCDWHSFLLKELPLQFDGFIYLQASPQVSMERMKIRNRKEEQSVKLDYLTQLHEKHENWLVDRKINPQGDTPVLVLDCNKDFVFDGEHKEDLMVKVEDFLCSLGVKSSCTVAAAEDPIDHKEDKIAAAQS